MSKIIGGRFSDGASGKAAIDALSKSGFGASEFESFYVNVVGQHALYPIGGDAYSD